MNFPWDFSSSQVACRFPGDTLEPVLISGAFLGAAMGRMLPKEVPKVVVFQKKLSWRSIEN